MNFLVKIIATFLLAVMLIISFIISLLLWRWEFIYEVYEMITYIWGSKEDE